MTIIQTKRFPWGWSALSLAVLVAGGVWLGPRLIKQDAGGVVLAGQKNWSMLGAASETPTLAAPMTGEATRSIEAIRSAVYKNALLAQIQPAGDWAVDAQGQLRPALSLRKRFEYYLLALGDASPAELRLLIQDEVRRAHGDKIAAEVMRIFDQYWALRSQQTDQRLVLNERETWEPAFQSLKALRRQYLGPAWADAFYRDEEDEFMRFVAQADGKAGPDKADLNLPVPQMGPGKDAAAIQAERVALYGEAAAQRLAQADAEWMQWEQRLASAKAEWQRLLASAELSDVQRQQAMDQYLQGHVPPDERMRVKGLLN